MNEQATKTKRPRPPLENRLLKICKEAKSRDDRYWDTSEYGKILRAEAREDVRQALRMLRARDYACRRFSFAVPNEDALERIAKLGPIIEVGAGRGYWARLLQDRGCDVIAFDKALPGLSNPYFASPGRFTDVKVGFGPMEAAIHSDRTLMLCWPDYDTPFAYETLIAYFESGGKKVIFIGEDEGGCCADDDFFYAINNIHLNVRRYSIPQWDGINDYCFIYELYSYADQTARSQHVETIRMGVEEKRRAKAGRAQWISGAAFAGSGAEARAKVVEKEFRIKYEENING